MRPGEDTLERTVTVTFDSEGSDPCKVCGAPVSWHRGLGAIVGHEYEAAEEPTCPNCGTVEHWRASCGLG